MYNKLRIRLNDYYQREDIVSNEEIISLYDLIKACDNVLGNFFEVIRGYDLENQINSKYQSLNSNLLKNIFHKKNNENNELIKDISSSINKENGDCSLCFSFNKPFGGGLYNFLTVNKNISTGDIYFNSNYLIEKKKQFVMANYDAIMQDLDTLEDFWNNFHIGFDGQIKKGNTFSSRILENDNNYAIQEFNDGFFKILLNYSGIYPSCYVTLSNKEEEQVFYREWLTLSCLKKDFDNNKDMYYKKIAINVNELNSFFRKIVELNYEKEKVKVLKK